MAELSIVVIIAAAGYIVTLPASFVARAWPMPIRLKWAAVVVAIVALIAESANGKPFWAAVWAFNGICALFVTYMGYRQREIEANDD